MDVRRVCKRQPSYFHFAEPNDATAATPRIARRLYEISFGFHSRVPRIIEIQRSRASILHHEKCYWPMIKWKFNWLIRNLWINRLKRNWTSFEFYGLGISSGSVRACHRKIWIAHRFKYTNADNLNFCLVKFVERCWINLTNILNVTIIPYNKHEM